MTLTIVSSLRRKLPHFIRVFPGICPSYIYRLPTETKASILWRYDEETSRSQTSFAQGYTERRSSVCLVGELHKSHWYQSISSLPSPPHRQRIMARRARIYHQPIIFLRNFVLISTRKFILDLYLRYIFLYRYFFPFLFLIKESFFIKNNYW